MTLMQDGWKKCRGPKLWYVLLAELWPIFCWKHSGIRNLPVQLHDSSLFWQSAEMSALIQCQVWTLAASDHRWSCSHSAAMKKFQRSVKLRSSPVVKQRQPYSWKQVTACLNFVTDHAGKYRSESSAQNLVWARSSRAAATAVTTAWCGRLACHFVQEVWLRRSGEHAATCSKCHHCCSMVKHAEFNRNLFAFSSA